MNVLESSAMILLVAALRVLLIGDSHSHHGEDADPNVAEISSFPKGDSPGSQMLGWLLQAGAGGARVDAKIGRSAYSLFRSEQGDALLAADRAWNPDLVIVMLGTNDLGLDVGVDKTYMQRIRDSFPGAEIWGIGPPDFADPTLHAQTAAIVGMMRDVFGPRFIDARPMTQDYLTQYRTSDGVHFYGQGADVFGYRLAAGLVTRRRLAWLSPLVAFGPFGELAYQSVLAVADAKTRQVPA